jgi:NurA-like 5'-3' nuclease
LEDKYPDLQLHNESYYTEREDVLQAYRDTTGIKDEGLRWIMLSQLRIEHKRTNISIIIHQIVNTNQHEWPLLVSYQENLQKLSNWQDKNKVRQYNNRKDIADDFIKYINGELADKSFSDLVNQLYNGYSVIRTAV